MELIALQLNPLWW